MRTEGSRIMGVGYEGQDIGLFLERLQKWDIDVVVDVRLTPISRKKGFSKTALSNALADAGIEYRHRRVLGNPKENRDGFWSPGSPKHDLARNAYRTLLQADEALAAIQELVDLTVEHRVAVLCFEASELCCHRSLVLDAVKDQLQVPAAA